MLAMGFSTISIASIVVTYYLREQGTGSISLVITQPGQIVTLVLLAYLENNDGDHSDDGIAASSLSFRSFEDTTNPLLGDYLPPVRSGNFPLGGNGIAGNLDDNPDLEWGIQNRTSSVNNFNLFSDPVVIMAKASDLMIRPSTWEV